MRVGTLMVLSLLLVLCAGVYAADTQSKVEPVKSDSAIVAAGPKVSLKADSMPMGEALDAFAKQSKEKILQESSVKGKVTLSLSDVPLESALTAACKGTNLVWRKVYLDPKSELIEKPDRLAATLRLISGLSFPDLVVAGASTSKTSIYCQQKSAVSATRDKVVKDLGMTAIYIVSNDAAVAAKEAAKNSPVSKYSDISKQQMDLFMKMTPEEREQALMEGLNVMDNAGPEYYSSLMQSFMNTSPEVLERISARQTQALFSMTPEQRRAMIKMNMDLMKKITPEQQKMLQEDAMAVMQQIKEQGGQP